MLSVVESIEYVVKKKESRSDVKQAFGVNKVTVVTVLGETDLFFSMNWNTCHVVCSFYNCMKKIFQ